MAVHLSRLAKHYIADFVNYREVTMFAGDWRAIYEVFSPAGIQRHRVPTPAYVLTTEFDLCVRKDVSPAAVEYLFTEGPEATFWYKVPTGFVSTIIEIFLQRSTKASVRHILCVCDMNTPGPTLLWQALYIDFFPCVCCQRTQLGEEQFPGIERPVSFYDTNLPGGIRTNNTARWYEAVETHIKQTPTYVIEVFHVRNTTSGQSMTVELWFDSLSQGVRGTSLFPANGRVQKNMLCRVKVYDGGCKNPVPLERPTPTPLRRKLLAEVLLEAYRFQDRYSLDVCQLVCGEWRGSIERSSEQLALYALSAIFTYNDNMREQELDHEWEATFVNYSECFGEVNGRTSHFLNAQPSEHSSAVIRRHLRNAFVKRVACNVMMHEFDWTVGMLLGLSNSTLVEKMDLRVRRFDEALIRRKVQTLNLAIMDPLLKALNDQHNFFGRPSIQQLAKLELRIVIINQRHALLEPHWLPALYESSGRRHFSVYYHLEPQGHSAVDVTRISSSLRKVLEDFETGGRDLAVDHFSLTSYVDVGSLVGNREPTFEGIAMPHISAVNFRRWNVYHYETADKKKCLTLLVAEDERRWTRSRVHLKRGKFTDFT